jgi:FMN phosphatase YigB (HAD superfamily)
MATIIFDFDDTLFDTKKFKKDIFGELISLGIKENIIKKTYKECRNDYCLLKHIKALKKHNLQIPNLIHKKISNLSLKSYLFPKVAKDLKKLSKENYLILLTKGDKGFQNTKINSSNISKYFEEIHITKKNKEEFLKDKKYPHPIYFINDKKSENRIIKKMFPKIIVRENKKGE